MSIFNQENNIFDLLYNLKECKEVGEQLDERIEWLIERKPFNDAVCSHLIESLDERERINGFTGVIEHHLRTFLS